MREKYRPEPPRTVREAALEVMRRRGMTTIFSNPGSTEIAFLVDLPPDLRFVLALHEASVVGLATGWAIGRDEPAFVNLHTTAGLGNAVGALATARANRAPLVVLVGQQDRRHLAAEPFLAGRLAGLAGDYPVWVHEPARARDVPVALDRAWHEASAGRGPALVIVPMDDWTAPAEDGMALLTPARLHRAAELDAEAVGELAGMLGEARAPALVAGAGADDARTWQALVALAERLACPVWQEPFGARAGFPQDHRLFAGHLPAARSRLRATLAAHDLVVVVGAPAFRQYAYEAGSLVEDGTRLVVLTDDPSEAHRSPVALALVGPLARACEILAELVPARDRASSQPRWRPPPPPPPKAGAPLRAAHLLAALAERLPQDAVLVEETPSSRPELQARVQAGAPLGFLSAAMGGLGFALPAATGLRMARPDRPVVAVVGDGSALYAIQALWSAAHYGAGVLFVILANGRYAVLDRLAEAVDGEPPWPAFEAVDVSGLARALGCRAERVDDHAGMLQALDAVLPTLARRSEPLVLEVVVEADETFDP
ncbi:MAG TPA: benzoylformate decarboxylase [Solirubrobacteraceae bacterium]|nr:benzoylformate decarboxylase [Solirubrobacteraceae bacterium]